MVSIPYLVKKYVIYWRMTIYSWGSNSHGQLGQGLRSEQLLEPLAVSIKVHVKSIVGGGKHTILISKSGELFSSGDNTQGQAAKDLSIKSLLSFQPVQFKIKILKISCGWDFNIALSEDNVVYGWGGNSFGQLGIPQHKTSCLSEPVKLFCDKAVDIGAGLRHAVIISDKGLAFSAGFGRKGQLGIILGGNKKILDSFTAVPSIKSACKVSCGENHTILCTQEGKIFAWGDNKFGQLGIDSEFQLYCKEPVLIHCEISCAKVDMLVSGWSHNAILTDEGKVISWGRNDYGQLGETREESWKPKRVEVLDGTKQITLGSNHGIALKRNGEILCWGWNEHGNCGTGNCENVYKPVLLNTFGYKPELIGTGSAHCFFYIN